MLDKEKIQRLKDFLYEMEVQTGICTIQEINENTDIKTFIENFKNEYKQFPMLEKNFNEYYYNELNESTNKTFIEILNEFI